MAFTQFTLDRSILQSRGIFNKYIYKTNDTMSDVLTANYFAESRFIAIDNDETNGMGWNGGIIEAQCSDGVVGGEISSDNSTLVKIEAIDPVFTTLEEGQVPKAGSDGKLIYSGVTVDTGTGEWTFDQSINVPQASVKISDVVSISEATFTTIIRDNVSNTNSITPGSIIDGEGSRPVGLLVAPSQQLILAQGDSGTEFNANPFTAQLLATRTNETDAVTIRVATAMPNTRITIIDNSTGITVKYIPSKAAVESNYNAETNPTGTKGIDLIAGDNLVDFNSVEPSNPALGIFNLGTTPLRQFAGESSTFKIEADSVSILGEPGGIPYFLNKIHFLEPRVLPFTQDVTQLGDNYTRLNTKYTSETPQEGGFVVTSKSTGITDTVSGGQFTAGEIGVSNPTILTDSFDTFAQNDIIQISNTKLNNYFMEVLDHTGNFLQLKGVGLVPKVESFTGDDLITTVDNAVLTKVEVAVKRFGISGLWEVATGSESPLIYNNEGHQIATESVLAGVSVAATQEPTGLGVANSIQVEFGPAQGTVSDPVMIDALGLITINKEETLHINVSFHFGRIGQPNVSILLFRALINGVQSGSTLAIKVENADAESYIESDVWVNAEVGDEVSYEVMRDAAGNNSGGLFSTIPTVETGSWNVAPTATIRIDRWV